MIELKETYYKPIFEIAKRIYLSEKPSDLMQMEDAMDLASKTYISAIKNYKPEKGASFRTYFSRSFSNNLRRELENQCKRGITHPAGSIYCLQEEESFDEAISREAFKASALEREEPYGEAACQAIVDLWPIISETFLTKREATLIEENILKGVEVKDIAAKCGKSHQSVYKAINNGIAKLRGNRRLLEMIQMRIEEIEPLDAA